MQTWPACGALFAFTPFDDWLTASMAVRSSLHFTNAWHESSGGIRTFYRALLASAEREGRSMALVVPGKDSSITPLGATTRLYTIRAARSPAFDRRYRVIWPHRFLPLNRSAVGRILALEQPDLVEVADKYTLCYVAGLLKRQAEPRPTVVGFSHERLDDGVRAHIPGGRLLRTATRGYLASCYLRQFDAHVANSAYTAQELHEAAEWAGIEGPARWSPDRVHVAPVGVDVRGFHPDKRSVLRRQFWLSCAGGTSASVLVVFAGRLSAEKHVSWLVPAVAGAVAAGLDARLVIAGDGPLARAVRQDARRRLPNRFVHLGQVDSQTLARLLASADYFLHPNPREPYGIAPLEAMASGAPVILPRAGGVLAYATDENSWLAEPSVAGLTAALVAAASDPIACRVRRDRALDTARQHDWTLVAPRCFQLFDRIHADRLARVQSCGEPVLSPVT